MAVNGSDKSFAKMEFPLGMKRQDAFPLDDSSVLYSLETHRPMPRAIPPPTLVRSFRWW